ncbi:MAG: hypothetical protein RRY79_06985 [Clostridia bacterium]
MRKSIVILIFAIMLLGASLPAFALTPNETVIEALDKTNCPETYIKYCINFMKSHTLTEAEANKVVPLIEQAGAIMGSKNAVDLTPAEVTAICDLWVKACEACGFKASYNLKDQKVNIVVTDKEGKVVHLTLTDSNIVQTGIEYPEIYIALLLLAVSSVAFIVIKRKTAA